MRYGLDAPYRSAPSNLGHYILAGLGGGVLFLILLALFKSVGAFFSWMIQNWATALIFLAALLIMAWLYSRHKSKQRRYQIEKHQLRAISPMAQN